MKVSLSGLLKNSARSIESLIENMRGRFTDEEIEEIESDFQPAYHARCLREVADHAADTAAGKHSVDEFANHYCLKKAVSGG